jgi:peptidoglycan/xylan/chitin deacetylase (PgdA/CDA1 family)
MESFWPQGKRAALSISFDDSRDSQLNNGIPLLDRYGVKGTFYVMPRVVEKNPDGWKNAQSSGHEIGNHTMTHPCSGNFGFAQHNALEEYSLARMEAELQDANDALRVLLGAQPQTFAYPCGQTYVGRGEATQSYVPLAARHFLAARGFNGESANDPRFCDLAQLIGIPGDIADFAIVKDRLDKTLADGFWLILAAHDVQESGGQAIAPQTLEAICRYGEEHPDLWVDTVANIAAYIRAQRG